MTDCTPTNMAFSRLGPRALHADFLGGRITTDAGVLPLREVARRTGLFDAPDRAIPDPRLPEMIRHDQKSMLARRITAIALGYEDLNGHQSLRSDPALQIAADEPPDPADPLASPPTPCRLENRVDRRALIQVAGVLLDQFIASHAKPPEHLILDFDATDDPVHGDQEGRFFHGYYDQHCFLPLYVLCGDEPPVAYLRPSNIDAARHSRAVLKPLVGKLRGAWPGVKITLRGDGGFCRRKLMRWCDSNGVGYVLGPAGNGKLEALAIDWTARARRQFERTGGPQRLFGSVGYAAGGRDRPRRVIVKAEHNAGGANPRFVVSNAPGDPQELHDGVFCRRGEMEDRIEEQQPGPFADRTSCHRFVANAFRPLLSSAAYVLIQALRREALPGTDPAVAQVGTIRLRLLKVAARLPVSVRRVRLHPASGYPYQATFEQVWRRPMGCPPPVVGTG